MEILIPFVTAFIIDKGIEAGDMQKVCLYGGIMILLAFLSLLFGIEAGRYAASASTMIHGSSRAAAMYPAASGSDYALPGHF